MKNLFYKFIFYVVLCSCFKGYSQLGIGTNVPASSATLELKSTTKGFLLPRLTSNQLNAIDNPAEGLMVYCKDCSPKTIFIFNGNDTGNDKANEPDDWTSLINNSKHRVTDKAGLPYGTVFSKKTGLTWLDRNLGAKQIAKTSKDTDAYGSYYQWGRAKDGHEKRENVAYGGLLNLPTDDSDKFILEKGPIEIWIDAASIPPNFNFWTDLDGENNPCPDGYRVPTVDELKNEFEGFNIISDSWSKNDLKLPAAGHRSGYDGEFAQVGDQGDYWSNKEDNDKDKAQMLRFSETPKPVYPSEPRGRGRSVRCIFGPSQYTSETVLSMIGAQADANKCTFKHIHLNYIKPAIFFLDEDNIIDYQVYTEDSKDAFGAPATIDQVQNMVYSVNAFKKIENKTSLTIDDLTNISPKVKNRVSANLDSYNTKFADQTAYKAARIGRGAGCS